MKKFKEIYMPPATFMPSDDGVKFVVRITAAVLAIVALFALSANLPPAECNLLRWCLVRS